MKIAIRKIFFLVVVFATALYACKKSNNAPPISQTLTIGGSSYSVDSVHIANGGAQIVAFDGTIPYNHSMSFNFQGSPKTGTYDVVDYQTAPGAGQVQVAGFDNQKTTFYFCNAAPAAVKVTLTNGKYSIVMNEVTAKIQLYGQNPGGSINLSASFSQQ